MATPMQKDPIWWLNRLAARMDSRRPRLEELRSYMNGCAPLPEGAEGVREAYQAFQKKARTNFGELLVDACAERMRVAGFLVGDSDEDDDAALKIWKDNRLDTGAADIHRDMLGLGVSYAIVGYNEDNELEVTPERPEQVITESDPRRPDKVRAALKVWRDEPAGRDYAYLYLPGVIHKFSRTISQASIVSVRNPDKDSGPRLSVAGGWDENPDESQGTGIDVIPVVPFHNRFMMGEYETHTDLLDRINWGILQRLVIVAMQAYRQRAIKSSDLPEDDENGDPIDYGEIFKPSPGALWMLPEGAELWESQQSSIQDILQANKDDIQHLAAVTRTPMSVFLPEGQNQSAEGASFAKEGLTFKAEDRISRVSPSWDQVLRLALLLQTGDEVDVHVQWLPADRQSLSERFDAATKAVDVPWRTKMTKILQFTGDEVDRMEQERAQDALTAALSAPPAQSAAQQPNGGVRPSEGQSGAQVTTDAQHQ